MLESFIHQLGTLSADQIALGCTLVLLQGAIFTVFPEEVVMIGLGMLCAHGKINFSHAFLAVLIGLLPANATMFWLGKKFGIQIIRRRPLRWVLKRRWIAQSKLLLRAYGRRLVFFTRFVPSVRAPLYFAAGMSNLGVLRFMQIDLMAALVHVPFLIWVGMHLPQHFEAMKH